MVGARLLATMAKDNQLPITLAKSNKRESPATALVIQSIFTVAFVWGASSHGSADNVLVLIGIPTTVIMASAVAGVLILRKREPDTERRFRVPLYPLPPLLFLGLSVWMLVATLQYKWQASLGSVALVIVVWLLKPVLRGRVAEENLS